MPLDNASFNDTHSPTDALAKQSRQAASNSESATHSTTPVGGVLREQDGQVAISTSPAGLGSTPVSKRRRHLIVPAIIACVVAGIVWNEVLKYHFVAKRWAEVVPGVVFRSGQISKWMIEETFLSHGIQAVVDMSVNEGGEHQLYELETVHKHDIEYFRFPLGGGGTGDIRMYANALAVLSRCADEGRPVVVHCAAGSTRTGGVVATYRMLIEKQSSEFAYEEMQRHGWRPAADDELVDYINDHMQELATLLVQNGVIDEVPEPLPTLGPAGNSN